MITLKDHAAAMQSTTCPACRSLPGKPCFGKKRNRVHRSRIKAMQAPAGFVHPRLAKSKTQRKAALEQMRSSGKDFYRSWEWKAARYEALKLNGRRCQCCGWAPGDTEGGHLVVDHIVPRSKRPDLELDLSNLQVLCNDCNMGKSNVHQDDFRTAMQKHRATVQ